MRKIQISKARICAPAFGAKVIAQYAVLGPYDFVNIVEAPDNKAIARVSLERGSRGTVEIMSLPAIPINEFIAMPPTSSSFFVFNKGKCASPFENVLANFIRCCAEGFS